MDNSHGRISHTQGTPGSTAVWSTHESEHWKTCLKCPAFDFLLRTMVDVNICACALIAAVSITLDNVTPWVPSPYLLVVE